MQRPGNNRVGISAIKYSSFYCFANIEHAALLIQGGGGAAAWQVMADQRVEINDGHLNLSPSCKSSNPAVPDHPSEPGLYFELIIVNHSH